MKEYYIINFIIKEKKYFCIWYCGSNKDSLLTTNGKRLLSFSEFEEVKRYCIQQGIYLKEKEEKEEDISSYDVDFFINWCDKCEVKEINPSLFLDFWNIIQDIAYSVNQHFYGNEDGEDNSILYVYKQMFYGTNLEVMRGKDGELYYPKWDNQDIEIINKVVKDGLRILEKALQIKIL